MGLISRALLVSCNHSDSWFTVADRIMMCTKLVVLCSFRLTFTDCVSRESKVIGIIIIIIIIIII